MVPLDGSPFSETALPLALTLARHAEATVHLTYVYTPSVPDSLFDLKPAQLYQQEQNELEQMRIYLTDLAERLATQWHIAVTPTILDGPIVETLIAQSQDIQADLIVMCTHARGSFQRAFLGSVADELVRRSYAPVLLLHPTNTTKQVASEPIGTPLRRIVVALDGSPLAEHALGPALALKQLTNAELTLVQAALPTATDYIGLADAMSTGSQILDLREAEAAIYLEGVATELQQRGINVATKVLVEQPVQAILHVATEEQADLIVLATHGRGGFGRALLGSITDQIIRRSPIPVLVCRPDTGARVSLKPTTAQHSLFGL
jgi:nucleotide-binding universal stress UspA family protein